MASERDSFDKKKKWEETFQEMSSTLNLMKLPFAHNVYIIALLKAQDSLILGKTS